MSILNDVDLHRMIIATIEGEKPLVEDLLKPPIRSPISPSQASPDPWFGPKSAIQSSSVDLHVGNIYLPGTSDAEPGSANNPKTDHILTIGNTVVITTRERLNLPNDIAAIGFPHSRLSFRGLLLPNIGHVDPGYSGVLRFVAMNIGREPIPLKEGELIATILFFHLSSKSREDWKQRNADTVDRQPCQNEINRLSADFLDVDRRSAVAATKAVKEAQTTAQWLGLYGPSLALVGAIILAFLGAQSVKNDVDSIKTLLGIKQAKSEEIQRLTQSLNENAAEIGKLREAFAAKNAAATSSSTNGQGGRP